MKNTCIIYMLDVYLCKYYFLRTIPEISFASLWTSAMIWFILIEVGKMR